MQSNSSSATLRFFGEAENMLEEARKVMIGRLSELSARPTAALQWPATSQPMTTLLNWLDVSHFQLQICALTMLGNLAYQSENLCTDLLQQGLGEKLATVLTNTKNGLVLKTALGAVQRFAKSNQHRDSLGQSDILPAITPKWMQKINLPLQSAALAATRQLLSGSLGNVDRFLQRPGISESETLTILLHTFHNAETPEAQVDLAWTMERMWRTIYSNPDVRNASEEGGGYSTNAIATSMVRKTIPDIYRKHPRIMDPFQIILSHGSQDNIIATTYTMSLMNNTKAGQEAIYEAFCTGEGKNVLSRILDDIGNPKAQVNAWSLLQSLKGSYVSPPTANDWGLGVDVIYTGC